MIYLFVGILSDLVSLPEQHSEETFGTVVPVSDGP